MACSKDVRAFRFSETLTVGIYQVTDTWPPDVDGDLGAHLRMMAPAISDSILDGCSWRGPSARGAWETALRLLERLADGIDRADRLGLLDPESALALLEAQSGAAVEVLAILEDLEAKLPAIAERTSEGRPPAKREMDLLKAA